MKMKKTRIDLGNGLIYENGEIKECITEGTSVKEWMSWDEGWQWVLDSLKKLEENQDEKNL